MTSLSFLPTLPTTRSRYVPSIRSQNILNSSPITIGPTQQPSLKWFPNTKLKPLDLDNDKQKENVLTDSTNDLQVTDYDAKETEETKHQDIFKFETGQSFNFGNQSKTSSPFQFGIPSNKSTLTLNDNAEEKQQRPEQRPDSTATFGLTFNTNGMKTSSTFNFTTSSNSSPSFFDMNETKCEQQKNTDDSKQNNENNGKMTFEKRPRRRYDEHYTM